jgi:hypothetical protein
MNRRLFEEGAGEDVPSLMALVIFISLWGLFITTAALYSVRLGV